MTSDQAAQPTEKEQLARARQIVMDQLARRDRSRHELATKLAQRGVPSELIDPLLDKFVAAGLINDAEFARQWVQTRHRRRHLSRRALAHELTQKGVSEADMAAALQLIDSQDEETAAAALVAQKLPGMAHLPRDTQLRRLGGLLARRGYARGLSYRVIAAALADGADSSEADASPLGW